MHIWHICKTRKNTQGKTLQVYKFHTVILSLFTFCKPYYLYSPQKLRSVLAVNLDPYFVILEVKLLECLRYCEEWNYLTFNSISNSDLNLRSFFERYHQLVFQCHHQFVQWPLDKFINILVDSSHFYSIGFSQKQSSRGVL